MAELPGGTVTLVFTDIEGSTRLLASLGSRYEAVLADDRRLLRAAFSSLAVIEVDTQGDAFFYAFAKAHAAITAAVEAQRALSSHDFSPGVEFRVRMGIHSGEPSLTEEGYVGADVHLGASICAAPGALRSWSPPRPRDSCPRVWKTSPCVLSGTTRSRTSTSGWSSIRSWPRA